MLINIKINKTIDDSVIVKKVLILWVSYLCSRGFSQIIIRKKNSYWSKRVHTIESMEIGAHRWGISKCKIGAD